VRTRSRVRFVFVLAAAFASVVTAGSSHAQTEDASKAAGDAFERGRRLMEQNDVPAACAAFAESRRLDPQIGVTLFLAECNYRLGKLGTAWSLFSQAAEAATAKGDPRAEVARGRASALEAVTPKLVVRVPPESDRSDLRIERDGEEFARKNWGIAVPVDEGAHVLVARADGFVPWRHVFEVHGGAGAVVVHVPALSPTSTAPSPSQQSPAQDRDSRRDILSVGLLGLGAVSIGVGAVFGFKTFATRDELDGVCPDYPVCNQAVLNRATSLNDSAYEQATISTVAIVIGAAIVSAGAVLLFTSPRTRATGSLASGVVRF
jgi:hypothetical protein